MEIVFRFGALLKITLVGLLWVHKFGPVGVCVWRGPTAHICRVVFITGKEMQFPSLATSGCHLRSLLNGC